jgi:hypothetical protein
MSEFKLRVRLRCKANGRGADPSEFHSCAIRWLVRWLTEEPALTIDQAVDVATHLAELPMEPDVIENIRLVAKLMAPSINSARSV